MSDSPFHSQIEQNIQTLLVEKKYLEAYNLCKELALKFPEESSYIELQTKIEAEIDKQNQAKIDKKIKDLDSLWKEEKYPEIIRSLQEILEIYPAHNKALKLYSKAQKLYAKQVKDLESNFERKQRERLDKDLKENPEMLIMDLFELEKNNPANPSVLKLTKEYRTKIILDKIAGKKELLDSSKYEDINNFIHQLHKIDDQNEEILKLEKLIEKKKAAQVFENEREYLYENRQHIETLIKIKKFDKAVKALEELLDKYPKDKKLQKLLAYAKGKFLTETKALAIKSIESHLPQLRESYQQNKENYIKI